MLKFKNFLLMPTLVMFLNLKHIILQHYTVIKIKISGTWNFSAKKKLLTKQGRKVITNWEKILELIFVVLYIVLEKYKY